MYNRVVTFMKQGTTEVVCKSLFIIIITQFFVCYFFF